MNDQHEQHLSTADMASAADRPTEARRDEVAREATASGAAEEGRMPSGDRDQAPLFPSSDADSLRERWRSIQATFVDEPRQAVEQADSLVAETMKRLAETFSEERQRLEAQWDRGDEVSTEDLRVALQRYRTFFDRLLSI